MKKATFVLIISIFFAAFSCHNKDISKVPALRVSKNGRFLENENGKPFFYLACTAWEIFHTLNREEATVYLENRAKKGFTVIQAVALAESNMLGSANAYGELPLIDLDPKSPNEKYFEFIDFVVNKAEELGLYIALMPTWGGNVVYKNQEKGKVIFNQENARIYGEFLGKRYQNKPIIWFLGGDQNIQNVETFEIWKAMAEGLRTGDQSKHLITYHPRGGNSSSEWFHNEKWVDFNLYQSGHTKRFNEVYEYATHDYLCYPPKPFVDGEPAYEDLPVRYWEFKPDNVETPANVLDSNKLIKDKSFYAKGYFTDYDVRIHAYWNLLSGACGYAYGNNAIWQMFKKGGTADILCLYDWRESMDRPGADDMRHVRKLFELRDFSKLIPDQSIIFGDNPKDSTHIRAAVASDASFLIAYMAIGQSVTISMNKISGTKIKAYWYDPREGTSKSAGEFENTGHKVFTPPSSGQNNDWILVLDNAHKYSNL